MSMESKQEDVAAGVEWSSNEHVFCHLRKHGRELNTLILWKHMHAPWSMNLATLVKRISSSNSWWDYLVYLRTKYQLSSPQIFDN